MLAPTEQPPPAPAGGGEAAELALLSALVSLNGLAAVQAANLLGAPQLRLLRDVARDGQYVHAWPLLRWLYAARLDQALLLIVGSRVLGEESDDEDDVGSGSGGGGGSGSVAGADVSGLTVERLGMSARARREALAALLSSPSSLAEEEADAAAAGAPSVLRAVARGRAQVRDMLLDDGGPFARAAPFTLQRLTELLLWPPPSGVSTHARADKLLVALGRVSAARAQRFAAAAAALAACSRLRA
jgi:hypothetical protein